MHYEWTTCFCFLNALRSKPDTLKTLKILCHWGKQCKQTRTWIEFQQLKQYIWLTGIIYFWSGLIIDCTSKLLFPRKCEISREYCTISVSSENYETFLFIFFSLVKSWHWSGVYYRKLTSKVKTEFTSKVKC